MHSRSTESPIFRRGSDDGFTLAEVLVALTIVTAVVAAGAAVFRSGLTSLSSAVRSARWNVAATLFDQTARAAFDGLPPAFWGRPPEPEKIENGFIIEDGADAAEYRIEFLFVGGGGKGASASGRTLVVRWGSRRVAIVGVRGIFFTRVTAPGGRTAGYEALLQGEGGSSQRYTLVFGGQHL